MRAIIIDDKDAKALLDSLKLESMPTNEAFFRCRSQARRSR
jgi:hypothetical protein